MVVGFALQSIQVSGGQEHNMRMGQSAFLLVYVLAEIETNLLKHKMTHCFNS
jgi:hypothetical protein